MYLRRLGILMSLSGLLLAGCTSQQKLFERAQRLESSDPAAAIKVYSRILDHTGNSDPQFVAKVRVQRGELLLLAKDPQSAYEEFQRAAEADPKNVEAHLRSANLLLMANSPERASEQASVVLRLQPGNTDAMAVLGIAALTSGRVPEGKVILKEVLSKRPDRVDLAVIIAEIDRTEGNLEEAQKLLLDAADTAPKDARPRLALGRIAEERGDNSSAEQNYRLAVHADD